MKRNQGYQGADLPATLDKLTLTNGQIKYRKEFLGRCVWLLASIVLILCTAIWKSW
jgi:hypothetical protein